MTQTRPKHFPTRGHLLLCQGQSCSGRGAQGLYTALWQALEQREWAYYKCGGSVRLTASGCLGACSFGPTLCVYRQQHAGGARLEEGWYAPTDLALALEVAGAVQTGAPLPERGRYGP